VSGDLDGDGDLDVVGAAQLAAALSWFENTAGDGSAWTEHAVDSALSGLRAAAVGDLDGDGDQDVIAAVSSGLAGVVTWYENLDGGGSSWAEHGIEGTFAAAKSVLAVDMDGDADPDVLGVGQTPYDDSISWWENTAGDGSAWSKHAVDGFFGGAGAAFPADIDGDLDMDVAGTDMVAAVHWWENTDGGGTSWTIHTVDDLFYDPKSMHAGDLDGDGDADLLGAAFDGHEVRWWENTGGDGSTWVAHSVDSFFDGANSAWAVDMDGDGNLDVAGAAEDLDEIAWYENTAGDGSVWIKRVIDGDFENVESIFAADLDGDGFTDLAGAAWFGDDIAWWESDCAP